MKITILDKNTLTRGDIDFSPIEALGDVTYYDILSFDEMIDVCKNADIVLTNKTAMSKEVIEKLPNLKYIGVFATGYNNVDLDVASSRSITVCNVPGYSTDSVTQLVFSYILTHATSLPDYNQSVARGDWVASKTFAYFPYHISELSGKVLGVVGFGAIGEKVASIGEAFGMKVIIYSRRKYEDCPYVQVEKEDLFKLSDYISLNCPLNKESENLVCEDTISLMKKDAFLINTARGGLVDSAALAKALNEERIAGAGIDVLVIEPMDENEPLLSAKNCLLSPHIGWASIESRKRLIIHVAENIKSWQDGNPINVVN